MKTTIVIGGGPAGMIASGFAGTNTKTILIEKNEKLGKKLFITGKGRCNVTNACDVEELIANTPGNPYFLYSAFYSFDSYATIDFFEKLGVKTKVERGNRVFPISEKSSDVIKALNKFMIKNNVDIRLNTKVVDLILEDNKISKVITDRGELEADNVIIATGGLSYSVTGSDGDGLRFAKKLGHIVTKTYPSLVPLKLSESWCIDLQGLSLKNVELSLNIDNKNVYKGFGEMMFTHFGITGPLVLKASRSLVGKYDKHKITGKIDLKPALSEKELDNRILKDFEKYKNKDFRNSLDDLLPQKMIPVIIKLLKIDENKKVNSITKEERRKLCNIIKNLPINIIGDIGFNQAVITCGGVCVDEIDPSTMKSKMIDNLYFAGEVIDVDSYTGGFNLQIAFATGYVAGNNVKS